MELHEATVHASKIDRMKILIKNATVLTMDPSLGNLANHDILLAGEVISQISPHIDPPDDAEVIDASDCIVTPGFVNCHHHMWQQILRTIATDWSLFDYVVGMRSIYGSLFSADDVYFSMYAAALDLLNHGVTTVLDHCHIINSPQHADAAVKALKEAGIRGTWCYGFYENLAPPPSLEVDDERPRDFTFEQRKLDAARVRAEHFKDNNPERNVLTFGIAPDEPEAVPIEKTIEQIVLARDLEARRITMHVAHGHYDIAHRQIVQQLHDKAMLGPDLVFSHGASFTDNELEAIRVSGAGIVATPDTETQMGMGHPVLFRADDAGCKTSLGIDITSNQGNDMVIQMRLALQVQREQDNRMSSIPIMIRRKTLEVLRMATMGGAEVMQLDYLVGSLTPGKKADLVIFRCDDISTVPIINPVGTVVFNTSPKNIDTVIVNGKIAKRDGKLIGVDLPSLLHELKVRSAKIVRMGVSIDRKGFEAQWKQAFRMCC